MSGFDPDVAFALTAKTRTKAPTASAKILAPPQPLKVPPAVLVTTGTSALLRNDDQKTWQDLRNLVIANIIALNGPFPRDEKKEIGLFKGFHGRWGADAFAIVHYAFEVVGGYWRGAPIMPGRFAKASDPYFAVPIKQRLDEVSTVTAW